MQQPTPAPLDQNQTHLPAHVIMVMLAMEEHAQVPIF
jgi:hypothetical protein